MLHGLQSDGQELTPQEDVALEPFNAALFEGIQDARYTG